MPLPVPQTENQLFDALTPQQEQMQRVNARFARATSPERMEMPIMDRMQNIHPDDLADAERYGGMAMGSMQNAGQAAAPSLLEIIKAGAAKRTLGNLKQGLPKEVFGTPAPQNFGKVIHKPGPPISKDFGKVILKD